MSWRKNAAQNLTKRMQLRQIWHILLASIICFSLFFPLHHRPSASGSLRAHVLRAAHKSILCTSWAFVMRSKSHAHRQNFVEICPILQSGKQRFSMMSLLLIYFYLLVGIIASIQRPVWSHSAFGTLFLPLIPLGGKRCSHRHVLSSSVRPPLAARLQTPPQKNPSCLQLWDSSLRQFIWFLFYIIATLHLHITKQHILCAAVAAHNTATC